MKLLEVIKKLDPTFSTLSSFLLAPSLHSFKMVRERGLLPLLSLTSCDEQLLDDVHGF